MPDNDFTYVLPSLGADMDEASLLEWKIKPGDRVKRGQVVAVLETVKAAIDAEIWVDGVVEELLVQPDKDRKIKVGAPLARLKTDKPVVDPTPPTPLPANVRVGARKSYVSALRQALTPPRPPATPPLCGGRWPAGRRF
jgi:pyruvate dehydrogenase E2 component (dihydrolipoamide acetyltransferase)